jgi:ArsR family transcriptional regulator
MLSSLVTLLKVLGDSSRLRILKLLQQKELCVSEISAILGLANSTVSRHLWLLRMAGIIRASREGKWVSFRLNSSISNRSIRAIVSTALEHIESDEAVLRDRRRAGKVDRVEVRRLQRSKR